MKHVPVMVEEILKVLSLPLGGVVLDGTLGLGGHSQYFLDAVGEHGTLIGLDWDENMLAIASENLREKSGKKILKHADFRQAGDILHDLSLKADGVLLDLGLNSAQVDDSTRGISFKDVGPLDMRMDRSRGEPASALLNRLSPLEIERILWEFGDERWAKAIAKSIVERRRTAPLRTTEDLVQCVLAAVPVGARDKRIHPATRTFQSVRIAVNGELDGLDEALRGIAEQLSPHGVLAVLSYHSGEDRIVKNAFRDLSEDGFCEVFRKPVVPSAIEVQRNPRSRSAKLRAIRHTPTSVEQEAVRVKDDPIGKVRKIER